MTPEQLRQLEDAAVLLAGYLMDIRIKEEVLIGMGDRFPAHQGKLIEQQNDLTDKARKIVKGLHGSFFPVIEVREDMVTVAAEYNK